MSETADFDPVIGEDTISSLLAEHMMSMWIEVMEMLLKLKSR